MDMKLDMLEGPHLDLHMDNLLVDPLSFLLFKSRSNTSLTFMVDR